MKNKKRRIHKINTTIVGNKYVVINGVTFPIDNVVLEYEPVIIYEDPSLPPEAQLEISFNMPLTKTRFRKLVNLMKKKK